MDNRNIELFGSFFEPAKDHVALGQLGAAVVMLWAEVPEALRARMLEAVDQMTGVPTTDKATHRVLDLVARNKPFSP
jgi:hypothetical protein